MNKDKQSFQAEGIMEKGYGFIPKLIMKDKELTIEAKAIYAYLSSYTGTGNTAYPSISLMCGDLDISEARFYKHRKLLIEKGYIVIEKKRNEGGWSNNVYRLPFKPYPQNLCTQNLSIQNLSIQNEGTKSNSLKSNSLKSNNSITEDPSPTSEKFDESTIEYQLSQRLYDKMVQNDSKAKHPNLSKWAEHIDKLIRLDERSIEDIERVIDYCQDDDFWKSNILSTNKLRMKFPQLYLKVKDRPVSKTITKSTDKGPKYKGREYTEETKTPPQRANYEGRGY